MFHPKITVLMAAYNAERYLREAVDSVLQQSFRDFEFIVFDDKSTDGSLEILKAYHDPRLIIIENAQNQGLTKNLVKGMELARGDYVARMDADDVCLPHRLQTQVAFLDQNADVSVVGSAVIFFDGAGYKFVGHQPLSHDEIKCELLYGFTMLHPSVMMRKADLARHGLNYDPHFVCSQDHDLWVRAIRCLRFANLHEPLLKMRDHPMKIGRTRRPKQEEMSNETRKRQLDELGVHYNADELRAFNQAAGGFAPKEEADLRHYEAILLKIFRVNRERAIFDQATLQSFGARRFRAWCRDGLIRRLKWGRYYWHSDIRSYDYASPREICGLLYRSATCCLS